MPLMINPNCPDCQQYNRTGDFFHSKENWDRFHKSGWIDGKSDWKPREELSETLDDFKKAWLKYKEFEREVWREKQMHYTIPEWKVKKIMSKKRK